MSAPESIHNLVEQFEARKPANETELRRQFVDPLFHALGWDVTDNRQVGHEVSVMVAEGGVERPKRPDYGFRIGGATQFFVETKPPHFNLKQDSLPAYQLRRYGWSGNQPVSVLTDFEEFSVYNCRIKPERRDSAATARLRYYECGEYIDHWDELEARFSREAVASGALREWVEGERVRGVESVDQAFLREMENWREALAKAIALHNRDLNQRQLNLLVQRTIDRIVFLRIAEDREIEAYGRLRSAAERENVYAGLTLLFHEADDKYNSGLFHFGAEKRASPSDEESLRIAIPDEPLRQIINSLYFPRSPYEFSVLPADILGQVYERFLGKVIEFRPSGAVSIQEKPEVRKAGGVYYTPTYIVAYIVQNTVGALLEGATPEDAAKLRILDPACGSGSFLSGAYQFLLDWHLAQYRAAPSRYRNRIRQTPEGIVLSTAEKRRILQNNIYGVDLDENAVEVSKLSLLLKMLERESEATGAQTLMFSAGGRILPDLSDNIKWGNSLIGSDFYRGAQAGLFADEEEMLRVKAFDWASEAGFGEIMRAGGFDAVIGNPPYIRIQTMKETATDTVPFYKKNYVAASKGNYDIYVVFVERGLQLLNERGLLGFILPHKFFNAKYGEPLRGLISSGSHLRKIVHFGAEQVFAGATTYTCLLFLDRQMKLAFDFISVPDLQEWQQNKRAMSGRIPIELGIADDWNFVVGPLAAIYDRLKLQSVTIKDLSKPFVGLQTSADTVFLFKEFTDVNEEVIAVRSKSLNASFEIERDLLKPVIRSGNIGRYWANPSAFVLFPYHFGQGKAQLISQEELKQEYPLAWNYLLKNKALLSSREHGKFAGDGWYQLYPKNLDLWEQPKLMMPYMITKLSAYLDLENMYFVNVTTGGFGLTFEKSRESLKYFVGLLNSKLLDLYFKQVSPNFRGGYFGANKRYLDQLPIRTIDFDNPADVQMHNEMVKLVDEMLGWHRRLPALEGEGLRVANMLIETTDREIDELVYRLYGLTDDEVAIVEGG